MRSFHGSAMRFVAAHFAGPFAGFALLILVLTVFHGDLWVADHLYAWEGAAWSLKSNAITESLIHQAGKQLSAALWLVALAAWLRSWMSRDLQAWRKPLGYLVLATLTATLVVVWMKSWTNMDCTWDLLRYGGERPYVDLWSARPGTLPRATCFPAGHASGGFTWMALYFFLLATRPRWKWWGLALGLVLGTLFGAGQQLRGAHFLSHDVTTAMVCWTTALAAYLLLLRGHAPEPDLSRPRLACSR